MTADEKRSLTILAAILALWWFSRPKEVVTAEISYGTPGQEENPFESNPYVVEF